MKKLYLVVCLLLLAGFCIPAGAATSDLTVYSNGTLRFASFTAGAESAFDGDASTAYCGSVTGAFSGRSVLTGVTVKAGSKIRGLKVSGSEDGVHWVELYTREKVNSTCIFGFNGSTYDDSSLNEMYTYAWRYLRFEMEYGSIAEIVLRGYAVEVSGTVAELDTSFGNGKGYDFSGSYYDDGRTKYLFDHILGSSAYGDAITYPDSTNKFAYITVRTAEDAPLRAVALAHKSNDGNVTRWNGVSIEASEDGETWSRLKVLPGDFSASNDLKQKTLFILNVEGENHYRYVRISSTSASISIGAIDLYTDTPVGEIPVNVLSGWDGDPYIAEKMPEESKKPQEDTQAPASNDSKEEEPPVSGTDAVSADEPSGGCGSVIVSPLVALAVVACLPVFGVLKKFHIE